MSIDTMSVVTFGAEQLVANAALYSEHRSLVNAASKYDSFDAAVAALTEVWEAMTYQKVNGASYTPAAELGFGSNNASQIACAVMGETTSLSEVRKALVALAPKVKKGKSK